jgi:hypothetical protein
MKSKYSLYINYLFIYLIFIYLSNIYLSNIYLSNITFLIDTPRGLFALLSS